MNVNQMAESNPQVSGPRLVSADLSAFDFALALAGAFALWRMSPATRVRTRGAPPGRTIAHRSREAQTPKL